MADQKISSPVEVVSDSKSRVALELMKHIDNFGSLDRDSKNKEYWLKLYRQCYKATHGLTLEDTLKED